MKIEIWQMTKEEWNKSDRSKQAYKASHMTKTEKLQFVMMTKKERKKGQNFFANLVHKILVKQAILGNKSVPSKVLKDYNFKPA